MQSVSEKRLLSARSGQKLSRYRHPPVRTSVKNRPLGSTSGNKDQTDPSKLVKQPARAVDGRSVSMVSAATRSASFDVALFLPPLPRNIDVKQLAIRNRSERQCFGGEGRGEGGEGAQENRNFKTYALGYEDSQPL